MGSAVSVPVDDAHDRSLGNAGVQMVAVAGVAEEEDWPFFGEQVLDSDATALETNWHVSADEKAPTSGQLWSLEVRFAVGERLQAKVKAARQAPTLLRQDYPGAAESPLAVDTWAAEVVVVAGEGILASSETAAADPMGWDRVELLNSC